MAERLLAEQQRWKSFSQHAKSASQKYDWNKIAEQIIQLYKTE